MDDATSAEHLALEIPSTIHKALTEIARVEGRTLQSVAVDAIAEHCAAALEMRASILRGEADVAAGRMIPHEDVIAGLRDIIESARTSRAS